MIKIVDYDAGNIRSVANMLSYLGFKWEIATSGSELAGAEKVILPGVGKFDFGMSKLTERGFINPLNKLAREDNIPVLGICLGAQLLGRRSAEGSLKGLGWIEADTVPFDKSRLGKQDRVPHMAWTDTEFRNGAKLAENLPGDSRFYYVHSFHLKCDNSEDELCHATHGYRFTSGIKKENVVGLQFHPEKSHRFGMQILQNFAELY